MTNILTIRDVEYSHDDILSFRVTSDQFDDVIWFGIPTLTKPHDDLIALAAGCIFGNFYDRVDFLHPVSPSVRVALEKITGATWNAPIGAPMPIVSRSETILNFSGGFDSLAALACLGDETTLVSMDFGSRFAREVDFFERFDPLIVRTNAREFAKAWTFMGVGSILLSSTLAAGYISFGSIFEASPWNFISRSGGHSAHPIFRASGMEVVNPVVGLSEFGSAFIAAKRFPGSISGSLESLADPHTEKFMRKTLIVKALQELFDLDVPLPKVLPTLAKPVGYGSNLAVDYLAPGFVHFSPVAYENWVDVPSPVLDLIDGIDPEFYWFDNTESFTPVRPQMASNIYSNKLELGMMPFRYRHWAELQKVTGLMKVFHKFPGPVV